MWRLNSVICKVSVELVDLLNDVVLNALKDDLEIIARATNVVLYVSMGTLQP